MTTTTIPKRGLLDAILFEPIELIISQPHQALISSASVFLVAAEAGMLVEWPYNVLLGIGAEWAYLRGLSSGQTVQTRWATALNWSAVALVVLYGSLWGLRKFGAIPDVPPLWGAVVLTLIHICCIGAVTLCSAMVHAAALAAERVERVRQQADGQVRLAVDQERTDRLQAAQDAIDLQRRQAESQLAIEQARKQADLAIWQTAQQAKMQLKMHAHDAPPKMQRHARPERMDAERGKCPKCGAELSHAQWLAAHRWGHCRGCKEQA